MNGDCLGAGAGICYSCFHEFESSLDGEFELSGSLGFLGSFLKFSKCRSMAFHDHCSGTGWELVIGCWEKLYIVCFAYSL